MEHLSKRQFQVLEFIKKYFAQYGYAPALKEIATELGLKSTGTVHGHLDALEKKNYIQRSYGYSRGIHLIEENTKPLVVEAQRKYRLELLERFSKIIEKKKIRYF